MSLGSLSSSASLESAPNRVRAAKDRETSRPDLAAVTSANASAVIGALAKPAAESSRLASLVASAKAAAVSLVTSPEPTGRIEKVKTVDELLAGANFRRREAPQAEETAVEPRSTSGGVTPADETEPTTPDPVAETDPGAAPVAEEQAPADPAPSEPDPAPATPEPPLSEPSPAEPVATAPAEPAPPPQQPSPEPAQPSTPPASGPGGSGAVSTGTGSTGSGSGSNGSGSGSDSNGSGSPASSPTGGLLGGLINRRV